MRPLKLKMSAFGPYAGVETIDFRILGESAFFLIHGPTGSGKTTILDAICFALFGKTSGDLRDGKQLRSDYSSRSPVTQVEFDFALGNEHYRVLRSPEQEVPKKRGSGNTKMLSAATLWKRTGIDKDTDEGTIVASRWEKVTEAAEDLLGFRYEQFRQVVMLPQGEFRRLLLANSKEREVILETLFQTELYRRIEDYFKQQAKNLNDSMKDLAARKSWTLEQSGLSTSDELAAQLQEDSTRAKDIAGQVALAQQNLQFVQEKLSAAKLIKTQFEERRQAELALAKLYTKEEIINNKRHELLQAKQAGALLEISGQVAQRRKDYLLAEEKLKQLAHEITAADHSLQITEKIFHQQQSLELKRNEASQLVSELSVLRDKALELKNAVEYHTTADRLAQAALLHYQEIQTKLQTTSKTLEEERTSCEQLKEEAMQLSARKIVDEQAAHLLSLRERREQLLQEFTMINQSEKAAKQQFEQTLSALDKAKHDYELLRKQLQQNQAAELAANLSEDQACPVCGSIHHPSPAKTLNAVSVDELDAKSRQVQELEQTLETCRQPINDLAINKGIIETEGKNIRQLLGSKADLSINSFKSEVETAKAALSSAEAASFKLTKKLEQLKLYEANLKNLQAESEIAENALTQCKDALAASKAILIEREKAIPEHLRETEKLEHESKQALSTRDAMQQAWQDAQKNYESASLQITTLKATYAASLEHSNIAKTSWLNEKEKFAAKIFDSGFDSEEAFNHAIRPAATIQLQEQEIKKFDEERLLAEDHVKRVVAATSLLDEPELQFYEEAVRQAQAESDNYIAIQATLTERLKKQQQLLTSIKQIDDELAKRETDYETIGRLAEVANGQNHLRLSFHRFVLATLLEDVTTAANTRLKMMSRGRYSLHRMNDPLHRNTAGGLDIEIEDMYTGNSRHVTTLSGGETFLASLALALGLADVVQNFSGGIYLDTIFVDEGFGTLDPESLDMAIQALVDLRQKGRLVGIISHVPELKERIEARLEIIPGDQGSITRWSALPTP